MGLRYRQQRSWHSGEYTRPHDTMPLLCGERDHNQQDWLPFTQKHCCKHKRNRCLDVTKEIVNAFSTQFYQFLLDSLNVEKQFGSCTCHTSNLKEKSKIVKSNWLRYRLASQSYQQPSSLSFESAQTNLPRCIAWKESTCVSEVGAFGGYCWWWSMNWGASSYTKL